MLYGKPIIEVSLEAQPLHLQLQTSGPRSGNYTALKPLTGNNECFYGIRAIIQSIHFGIIAGF